VGDGTLNVNAAAGILDYDYRKSFATRVFGGIADAEIESQTGKQDAF
jgi:hypothetical protein